MFIIFTDLDGTLLDADDYSFEAAQPMLTVLKQQQIPIIPVTSKTRQEVELLRQHLDLSEPFVVENGSGIFTDASDERFQLADAEAVDQYHMLRLGCSYAEAREGLQQLSHALRTELRGFADLSEAEIQEMTGLPLADVARAQARDFTEPFITPRHIEPEHLEATVEELGFRVVVGDRFSHLIGKQAGKGEAVKALTERYSANMRANATSGSSSGAVTTIGLGNSPNDLGLLGAVDVPIIVPGRNGPHPGLLGKNWAIAPYAYSKGWAAAVSQILEQKSTQLMGRAIH
ncbi:HAD-IIB family hydrolase [Leptolyngbya sp. AN02str]|uniref:HAD-IIB family hydrolase n=1 Tax=Leptolyngbya sp. AN02str TaxID=3423363 RepID=UPI003D31F196